MCSVISDKTEDRQVTRHSGLRCALVAFAMDLGESIRDGGSSLRRIVFHIATIAFLTSLIATPALGQKMYWTDTFTRKVQRANLDGSDVEDLFFSAQAGPRGITLDLDSNQMYWTDSELDVIQRANLDGSGRATLLETGPEPRGIALNLQVGHMYWTDRSLNTIQRANLDGTEVELLISTGLDDPFEIVLDVPAGHMYWADGGIGRQIGKIQRANLDGSNIVDLVAIDFTGPIGLALDIPSGHMYWTDFALDRVRRANLDGSNIVDLVTGLSSPLGLALDIMASKMYWTDTGTNKIQRADLDGSNIEDIVTNGLSNPREIAIIPCRSTGSDCQPNGVGDRCDILNGTSSDCNRNRVPDECDLVGGTSQDCNNTGVPDECEDDCNGNGREDSCDIADGISDDCNGNGVPDECEPDCNDNGIADTCDIADGTSNDCDGDGNGVPDECEPDCDANGVADSCDLSTGIADDCNRNAVPDSCDIANETSDDCNDNGIPDECEPDCNGNEVADSCDIDDETSDDCDSNGIPDECEPDCNNNGVADSCDIANATSNDCDSNGIPDECEPDCNGNGIADSCDIRDGTSDDCNANIIPDECDLADGTSGDCNNNAILDVCELDCNRNGLDDRCDLADGFSSDCNGNFVPDECETDCNENGVPDECDLASGIDLACAVMELVPTGSSGPFEIQGNKLFIPRGDVQVEFEIRASGWGQTPGSPGVIGYGVVIPTRSFMGANATPQNPGADLVIPQVQGCGTDTDCVTASPPPVSQTSTCGIFKQQLCDDSVPVFVRSRVCLNDLTKPCSAQSDCPVGSVCINNPDYLLGSGGSLTTFVFPSLPVSLGWEGFASREVAGVGATKLYAGTFRLVVPANADGAYSIRLDPRLTFLRAIRLPGIGPQTVIDGLLVVGRGACCMPDRSCEFLDEETCNTAGGTFILGVCEGNIGEDGISVACDGCPGEGDCCSANGTTGCRDATCCRTVCTLDRDCCDSAWDDACAELAITSCEPPAVVNLDIKPGSCPNPVNPKSNGVVPVAIVGSPCFDVNEIEVSSIVLGRADGVGKEITPAIKKNGRFHASIEDAATPFETTDCECNKLGGDGIHDLVLKFSTSEMNRAFGLNALPRGETIELVLRGSLQNGAAFEARDCITVPGAKRDSRVQRRNN